MAAPDRVLIGGDDPQGDLRLPTRLPARLSTQMALITH